MDAETAARSGIPEEHLHELDNGTFVHRGMFVSFGPGANCTLDTCPIEWTVYQYRPNLGVNSMFIALFALALAVHVFLGIRWRSFSFMTFMIVGCLFSVVGYIGRVILWTNPWSFGGFMVQMVFITTAPVFFTAAIYVTLSRAIRFFAPQISRLPPRLLYWLFISADVLCLVLQAAGGALSTTSSGSSQAGIDVAMAGLILQVIVLAIFCVFFADYMIRYWRLRKRDPAALKNQVGRNQGLFFGGLAAAIILILARCIYRVEELSEGYEDSEKITHEGLFIGLEGVLIFLSVCCLWVGHPGLGFTEAPSFEKRQGSEASSSKESEDVKAGEDVSGTV